MESILKELSIDQIILDDENPRLRFSKIEKGIYKWTQKKLVEEIKESLVFNKLLDSINQYGVIDPIWVHDLGNNQYQVVEGNMRVTAVKELVKKNISPPSGIKYNLIKAHILPKNTTKIQLEIQKAVLQTGKNPWGAFNEAAHIYELFWKNNMAIKQIANMLGKSISYVSNEIDNFKFYLEFIKYRKSKGDTDIDPKKYSFFKEAPTTVKSKFFKNNSSIQQYFELITPNNDGITRIPSVALKGGLRMFGKFVDDEYILNRFLKDKTITIEEAFVDFIDKTSLSKSSWLKKIPNLSKNMKSLSSSDRKKLLEKYESRQSLLSLYKELKKFF